VYACIGYYCTSNPHRAVSTSEQQQTEQRIEQWTPVAEQSGKLRKDMMTSVDGKMTKLGFTQPLSEFSEIRFLTIVSGG